MWIDGGYDVAIFSLLRTWLLYVRHVARGDIDEAEERLLELALMHWTNEWKSMSPSRQTIHS